MRLEDERELGAARAMAKVSLGISRLQAACCGASSMDASVECDIVY